MIEPITKPIIAKAKTNSDKRNPLNIDFGVSTEWIDLLKGLLITVYVSYFGSRGIEKYKYISQKK